MAALKFHNRKYPTITARPSVQVFQFYIYYPTINICANSIMWLTTTLTIERFLFVCYPLWARATCDRRAAKVLRMRYTT